MGNAWLPVNETARMVNLREAIKNYCIADGDETYNRYVQCHLTDVTEAGDKRKTVTWADPDRVEDFDRPIMDYLTYLYGKYLRKLRQYQGFPQDEEISLYLKPPTVAQLKEMIRRETDEAKK